MKKRKVLAWLAALLLALSLAACGPAAGEGTSSSPEEGSAGSAKPAALKPMVFVNGALYYSTGRESDIAARCGVMDGEIDKSVDSGTVPTEEGQSNFGTGYGWQLVSDTEIDVCMDERWMRFVRSDRSAPFAEQMERFACQTGAELLSGRENGCYSPVSLYLALSMAATGAAGETQAQMYSLLGAEDTERLAGECGALHQRLYRDDKNSKLYLANSVWTRQDITPREEYAARLRDHFGAEQFSVPFDAKTNREMTQWVKKHTQGLLTPEFDHDAQTVEVLLNTIYFKEAWQEPFVKEATQAGTFTDGDGAAVAADFMHISTIDGAYAGQAYTRAALPFAGGGEMIFVLPAEGETVDTLMSAHGLQKLLDSGAAGRENQERSYEIRWSVPKFRMGGERNLIPMLQTLGIVDAFDPMRADFSAASDTAAYISAVRQGAYFSVDEAGVEAAAYTEISKNEFAMMVDETLEMNLNRPFLYAVRSGDGTLLFMGVCANPGVEEVCGYPRADAVPQGTPVKE